MHRLFCAWSGWGNCNTAAASFNEDISAWDTSGVTDMSTMFARASAFNQPLSDWRVDKVKSMGEIFVGASAFDQDLGWCLEYDISPYRPFSKTACESTWCGVAQKDVIGICEPWFRPCLISNEDRDCIINTPTLIIMIIIVLVLLACANCYVRCRKKKDETCVAAACRLLCCCCRCCCCCCFCRRKKKEPSSLTWSDYSGDGHFSGGATFGKPSSWKAEFVKSDFIPQREGELKNRGTRVIGPGVVEAPGWCGHGSRFTYSAKKDAWGEYDMKARRITGVWNRYKGERVTMGQTVVPPDSESPRDEPDEEATAPESLETRAAAEAKAAETVERPPGFARKLSSFLFGEQEEESTALAVAEAEETPSAEQPPPPPARRTEPEPAAKAEEMYNQISAWYDEPESAALRATWGAFPDPEDFQTWPGFVAVTNAFLDREAG